MSLNSSNGWPSIKIWQRYRELMLVCILLVLPFGFYFTQSAESRDASFVGRLLAAVSGPIESAVQSVVGAFNDTLSRYAQLQGVELENERLKTMLGRLTAQNAQLNEELVQMETLRRLLRVTEQPSEVHFLHAQVVAMSPVALFRSMRIDRGSRDGLELGSAVVVYEGVVGRIAALYPDYADVMLLTDANSSADVLVQRTRARARIRGQGRDDDFVFDAQYLSRQAEVEPGDLLVTSGVGKTFPKGLSVGRVMGVERRAFGLYQRAVVQPSVDFTRLEHVLVVTAGEPRAVDSPL